MRQALLVGHHEMHMFVREKVAYVWLLLVPLLFSFFMGFANRGPGDPSDPRPRVLIANEDEGTLGSLLVGAIQARGLNAVTNDPDDEVERGVRIPTDFTAAIQRKEQADVEFFQAEGSGERPAALIELRLFRGLLAMNTALARGAIEQGDSILTNTTQLEAWLQAPRSVELKAKFAGRKPVPAGFNQSLPGILVMFLMMNGLVFGGTSLALERQSGVLRRLVVHPIRRHELVLGKIYGRLILALVQATVMLLVGRFAFGLPVFGSPLGMSLVVGAYAWTCASWGVLVGASASNPDKVTGICVLAALMMAALGGCWWPMEIAPDWMRAVSYFVPTGWAMDAMHQLISFGGGLAEVGSQILAQMGFAIAGSIAAWKLLRY